MMKTFCMIVFIGISGAVITGVLLERQKVRAGQECGLTSPANHVKAYGT